MSLSGEKLDIVDKDQIPKHTIFITIDGARYKYLEKYYTPNIDNLVKNGVSFRNAVAGSCLACTAPGISIMSTGLPVKEHGICTSDEWYDKKEGKLIYLYDSEKDILHMNKPTLGDFLKRKNQKAKVCAISTKDRHALLLAGKQADLIVYSYREIVSKKAPSTFSGAGVNANYYSWAERINHHLPLYLKNIKQERIVNWEGKIFHHKGVDVADTSLIDEFTMNSALKVIENEKPALFFIGLVSPNITAHLYGIDSAEIEDSIEAVDGQIGKLLKKLDKMGWSNDTLIVIASDHGMNERPIGIDIITSLKKRGHKDIVENILYLSEGATGGVYINNTKPAIVKITVEAIREIDHVNEVWYKYDDKAPWYIQKFAHERTPDILIIPDANSVILEEGEIRPQVSTNHGPPYPPDINIWLIFSGVGVKKLGKVGDMLDYSSKKLISDKEIKELPVQWDIAPTVKDIWGIEE